MYKQLIEPESQEINLNIDYFGNKIILYTNKATIMNRLERSGYKPKEIETIKGEPCSVVYEFNFDEWPRFVSRGMFKCTKNLL